MTSILISSDDPQISDDIAAQLVERDGYTLLGPSLLDELAKQKDLSKTKLGWALDGSGGRRLSKAERALLLCQIQTATLEALQEDHVVSTGLGAHLHVKGVSHILHLRVLADPAQRAEALAAEQSISVKKAARTLEKERQNRSRFSEESFGVDENDPSLYDVVVQLKQITPTRVIQIVRDTAKFRGFQTMTYSRKCLADLVLASRVREVLLPELPDILVEADGDRAIVRVKCSSRKKQQVVARIKERAGALEGVGLVEVHAVRNLRDVDAEPEPDPRAFLKPE